MIHVKYVDLSNCNQNKRYTIDILRIYVLQFMIKFVSKIAQFNVVI